MMGTVTEYMDGYINIDDASKYMGEQNIEPLLIGLSM